MKPAARTSSRRRASTGSSPLRRGEGPRDCGGQCPGANLRPANRYRDLNSGSCPLLLDCFDILRDLVGGSRRKKPFLRNRAPVIEGGKSAGGENCRDQQTRPVQRDTEARDRKNDRIET